MGGGRSLSELGMGTCAWPGGLPAALGVQVVVATASDTAGIGVGAAASWDLVTGPLRPPADSGLVFHYYDSTGVATAVASLVHRVELVR